jgi:hypothetical protein
MLQIPLAEVPNQTISFNADNVLWSLHVYQGGNFMCADILKNGIPTINGIRCFGGIALLQYDYMTAPNLGNFLFDVDADWTEFGLSCNLFYLSQSEMAEFNAAMENWA